MVANESWGFSNDGSLQQVEFAQHKVHHNADSSSAIAIKYRDATVLLRISSKKTRGESLRIPTDDRNAFSNAHCMCTFVGEGADCILMQSLCRNFDREVIKSEGHSYSASRLAFRLADAAQRSSTGLSGFRPLAVNTIVIDTDMRKRQRTQFGDIYMIDTSGNFVNVKAACVGCKAERVRAWLGTRGMYIAGQWARRAHRSNDSNKDNNNAQNKDEDKDTNKDTNKDNDVISNEDTQLRCDSSQDEKFSLNGTMNGGLDSYVDRSEVACLNLAEQCLLENIPVDALYAGHYAISMALFSPRCRNICNRHPCRSISTLVLRRLVEEYKAGAFANHTNSNSYSSEHTVSSVLGDWWAAHTSESVEIDTITSPSLSKPAWRIIN